MNLGGGNILSISITFECDKILSLKVDLNTKQTIYSYKKTAHTGMGSAAVTYQFYMFILNATHIAKYTNFDPNNLKLLGTIQLPTPSNSSDYQIQATGADSSNQYLLLIYPFAYTLLNL